MGSSTAIMTAAAKPQRLCNQPVNDCPYLQMVKKDKICKLEETLICRIDPPRKTAPISAAPMDGSMVESKRAVGF